LLSLYDAEPYQTIKRGLDDESIDLLCRYCHRAVQVESHMPADHRQIREFD